MGRGVIGDTPASTGDDPGDEEILTQRLAAVGNVSNERSTTGFRRRRSSGLLFQIRRKIRRAEVPESSMRPEPPSI